MVDLDRQVLAALAENLLLLLLYDFTRTVMGVDDRIANLEVDLFELDFYFEVKIFK